MAITVKEIVKEYLTLHGFTGLFDTNGCGCEIDDLMPCIDNSCDGCEAGYRKVCTPEDYEECGCGSYEGYAENKWVICEQKPTPPTQEDSDGRN